MHARNYSSEESSESELALLDESFAERGIVEAEAGVAAWASGTPLEEIKQGAYGLKISVPAVSSISSSGLTNSRSVDAEG